MMEERYSGRETLYQSLMTRSFYALPITELQVRAEQTHFLDNHDQIVEKIPYAQMQIIFIRLK